MNKNLTQDEQKIRAALDQLILKGFQPARKSWGILPGSFELSAHTNQQCCGLGALIISGMKREGTHYSLRLPPHLTHKIESVLPLLVQEKLGWTEEETSAFTLGWDMGRPNGLELLHREHNDLGRRLSIEYIEGIKVQP